MRLDRFLYLLLALGVAACTGGASGDQPWWAVGEGDPNASNAGSEDDDDDDDDDDDEPLEDGTLFWAEVSVEPGQSLSGFAEYVVVAGSAEACIVVFDTVGTVRDDCAVCRGACALSTAAAAAALDEGCAAAGLDPAAMPALAVGAQGEQLLMDDGSGWTVRGEVWSEEEGLWGLEAWLPGEEEE